MFPASFRGMRASRLVEMLVWLQLRGGGSARELAAALEVSVRTIYRDVEALSAAGVPVHTEVGRNGGIRIDPAYRVAGLPRLDAAEARGMLFAAVPAIADQLGFDAALADELLLPAMEPSAERAARAVRDRLLVEPTHWFVPQEDTPALAEVARAVWESREARLGYRGTDVLVRPLGLVLKRDTWYLLALARGRRTPERATRVFRLSRVEAVTVLDHRFDRPPGFDLRSEWAARRRAFLDSIPELPVTVRVAPAAEPLLALLEGRAPALPLPADTERDEHGWARVTLRFDRPDGAVRHLLGFGAVLEVLHPPEVRERMAEAAAGLAGLYAVPAGAASAGGPR